jgi:3-methyladenine DNA glycosylase AlkD
MTGAGNMAKDIIAAVRRELAQQADTNTAAQYQRFFKEKAAFHGVKSNTVQKIARTYLKEIRLFSKLEVFSLCEELLKSDYTEEASIAFEWSYSRYREYESADFAIFEDWLKKYVNNWAKCDTLCNHTIGTFIEKYPRFIENLKYWSKSDNRWLRRAAAVTLIIPARNGKFLKDVFEIADALLTDGDDLVQKGYGWLLKDTAMKHQLEIFDYVMKNKEIMPRTALRYAIERMPSELKRRAMEK